MEKRDKRIFSIRTLGSLKKISASFRPKDIFFKVRGQMAVVLGIGVVSVFNLTGINEAYCEIILIIPLIYSALDTSLPSGLLSWAIIGTYYIYRYMAYLHGTDGIKADTTYMVIDMITFIIAVFIINYLKSNVRAKAGASINECELNKKLIESKKRYRRLIESIPDAVLIHINGKIVFANHSLAIMLGVDDRKKLYGMNVFDFTAPEYKEAVKERIHLVQGENKRVPLIEQRMKKTDGSTIYVEVSAIYYEFDDTPASLVVIRDITERKESEELKRNMEENRRLLNQALEYDRLKNEFLANISHELRTPLNVILSALQLLELNLNEISIKVKNDKVDRYTIMMRQNCYRLLRLINNLIDITKIDAGFLKLNLRNQNIVSVVEDITLSVAEYIENKSIYLEFDTDVEEKIMAIDPDKIERIILNLLSNAIKFTEPGGSILVNIYDRESSIVISVRDTGTGIQEDKINLIFERFSQVNKSLIKNSQGSGIGLSLVKSLVELHSGSISVKSRYGEGTEFLIELPIKLLDDDRNEEEYEFAQQNRVEKINIEFSDIYSC